MKQSLKELMNQKNVNTRPIIMVLIGLGFLSVILAATMIAAGQNLNLGSGGSKGQQIDANGVSPTLSADGMILAVIEKLDTENKQITLFDVDANEMIPLTYTGGTNITDKYGQIMSMNQMSVGMMVDAAYQQNHNKLTSMNISTRAWVYPDVSNLSIDHTNLIMKIASTKYKYTNDLFILDGEDIVTVEDLAEQDILTVWGDEETIWSIVVNKGHGTVKLKDYEEYLGDSITIGYESLLQITDDLEVTVREGIFNLTVENGLYSATKSLTVKRNEVNYVSLGDLGPIGLKKSDVTFEISPYGADLYIDGTLTTYADAVVLNYGQHSIVASLGGYSTYEGTIEVASESKNIKIDLPEATSSDSAVVTETNNDSDSTSSETDTDTSTDNDSDSDDTSTTTDDTEYSSEDTEYTLHDGDSLDKSHKIYIKAPDAASVYLDGDYMGKAPCTFDKIIGSHVLTFIRDGYETMSYTVEVSDDKLDAYFTFPPLTKSE